MLEDDLICRIWFQEDDMQTAQWIIGLVDYNQIVSPFNGYIELKNYFDKTIGKRDIKDIIDVLTGESIFSEMLFVDSSPTVSMES